MMKYNTKIYKYSNYTKTKTNITLDNNKELKVIEERYNNSILYRLLYLKDNMGKWIKSRLRTYKGRQLHNIVDSYNKE